MDGREGDEMRLEDTTGWTEHARVRGLGLVKYTEDEPVPDALFAGIVRSDVAHAIIQNIDLTEAASIPGVVKVITFEDVQSAAHELYYGAGYRDQPIIADGRVRHFGEPVAVVLADSLRTARTAAGRVSVEYLELPLVEGDLEALASQFAIHDTVELASDFEDLKGIKPSADEPNVYLRYGLKTGDFDQVASNAAYVFEHTFTTASVCATPLERIATCAIPMPNGGLEIHTETQMPSYVRRQLARMFAIPESMIRIVQAPLGGGFGFKVYIRLEALAAACALIAKRPVWITTTMEEQFYLPNRRGTTTSITSALDADGIILARRCRTVWNGGAYADIGPRMVQKSGMVAAGPYNIPVIDVESVGVYSNRIPAGAIRGFGVPQVVWAHELHTDMIAAALDVDPVALRRRNMMVAGSVHQSGTSIGDCDPKEVLDALVAELGPARADHDVDGSGIRRGRGLAVGLKAVLTPSTSVVKITLGPDGSATVHCGTVEMGQGATVTIAKIVAEQLNLPVESVKVVSGDTDSVPWDMGTMGSRSTYHMSKAIGQAVEQLRAQLISFVESMAPSPPPDDFDPFRAEGGVSNFLRSHFGAMGATLTGVGSFTPEYVKPDGNGKSPRVTEFWMCSATGVEVSVDERTGVTRIDRLVTIADVGRAIHPELVRTQLSGGAIMAASMSVAEEVKYDEHAQLLNPGLAFYRIFGFGDTPAEVFTDSLPRPPEAAPRGAGEAGTFAVAPAIAAAVHDAIGAWVTDLPITPERVLTAIEGVDR
jgi:CO/xanthine dehydrogenase Mo-binding subunit